MKRRARRHTIRPEKVTGATVTNSQIRAENRANPTMLDRLMVAIHSTDPQLRAGARAEFAALINARAKESSHGK